MIGAWLRDERVWCAALLLVARSAVKLYLDREIVGRADAARRRIARGPDPEPQVIKVPAGATIDRLGAIQKPAPKKMRKR